MIKVKCHRCGYEREYNGEKEKLLDKYPQYVSCTKCHTSIKLVNPKVHNTIQKGGKDK